MADFTPQRIGMALMAGGAAYVAYNLLIKPADDQARRAALEANAGQNPSTQQAQKLVSALDPDFLIHNATNRDGVFAAAKEIADFDSVVKAYAVLRSGRSLDADLRKSLSDQDYRAFYTAVHINPQTKTDASGNTVVVKPGAALVAGPIIFANTTLNLRATPEVLGTSNLNGYKLQVVKDFARLYHDGISALWSKGKNNIVLTAQKNDFIGYWTGRQATDSKNNTNFIEIINVIDGKSATCPPLLKPFHGMAFRFWVSASSNLITAYKTYAEAIKNLGGSWPYGWRKPSLPAATNTLKGVGAVGSQLFTRVDAKIYNRDLRQPVPVKKGVVLGSRALSVRTPGGITYHQFVAPDGTTGWINSYATNHPE